MTVCKVKSEILFELCKCINVKSFFTRIDNNRLVKETILRTEDNNNTKQNFKKKKHEHEMFGLKNFKEKTSNGDKSFRKVNFELTVKKKYQQEN